MRVLRQGTNGFTCMADNPASPGPDPMCGDANAMAWIDAWMATNRLRPTRSASCTCWKPAPMPGTPTLMLTAPTTGNHWIETGPHVMVVGAKGMLDGYPAQPTQYGEALRHVAGHAL